MGILLPLVDKKQCEKLLNIIMDVLDESADNCVYKNNINPLKIGLMIYKMIDDIMVKFPSLDFLCNQIKDKLKE